MHHIEKGKIGVMNSNFSREITNKYSDLCISTKFNPMILINKITIQMKWLEFIYAFPSMILKKEIYNSFTEKSLKFIRYILNISLNLAFPFNKHILKYYFSKDNINYKNPTEFKTKKTIITAYSHQVHSLKESFLKIFRDDSIQRINNIFMDKSFFISTNELKNSSNIHNALEQMISYYTHPLINYFEYTKTDQYRNFEKRQTIWNERLNFLNSNYFSNYFFRLIDKIHSFSNFKSKDDYLLFAHGDSQYTLQPDKLSHKKGFRKNNVDFYPKIPIMGLIINDYSKWTDFGCKKNEWPVKKGIPNIINEYYLKSISQSLISNKSIYKSNFTLSNNLNTSFDSYNAPKIVNSPLNYTYPKIGHLKSAQTEIVNEKVIKKEYNPETPQVPEIDLNRVVDQVYSAIEMKLKIEKERRGLFG